MTVPPRLSEADRGHRRRRRIAAVLRRFRTALPLAAVFVFIDCAPSMSHQTTEPGPTITAIRDAGKELVGSSPVRIDAGSGAFAAPTDAATEDRAQAAADGGAGPELDRAPLVWTPAPSPSEPSGPIPAVQIAAAKHDTCALLRDGTLRCWGENYFGEIGPNHNRDVGPTRPSLFGQARKVVVSGETICVLTTRGAVQCQGVDLRNRPRHRGFFTFERQIYRDLAVGSDRLVLITNNGLAYCMGNNGYGECGESGWGFVEVATELEIAHVPKYTPAMALLSKMRVKAIALGESHNCRIDYDNIIRCWGRNDAQQLGSADDFDAPSPRVVTGLGQAASLALGRSHSCALLMNGHVVCWGSNSALQLGREGIQVSAGPLEVPSVENVVDLASHEDSICAVRRDGAVLCWGNRQRPHIIADLPPVAEVAIGYEHACARSPGGDVFCWGNDDHLQLGAKIDGPSTVPIEVHWR